MKPLALEVTAPSGSAATVVAFPQTGLAPVLDATQSFRGLLLTYTLTLLSLVLVGSLWGKVGFNLLIVAMGWPHVGFGLLFNLRRLGHSEIRAQVSFGYLLIVAIVIGFVHSQIPMTTVIYLYFVFHALRDEILIYHHRSTSHRFTGEVFDRRGLMWLAAAVAFTIPAQLLSRAPAAQLKWSWIEMGAAAVLAGLALICRPQQFFESRQGLRYGLFTALLIFLAIAGLRMLRLYGLPAPLFFSFLVVFHYFSWYVFSFEKMNGRRRPAADAGNRSFSFFHRISTPKGFAAAILISNALSFLVAYAYQVRHLSASLAYGFDLKYFLYILVLHVTTSFIPKSPARVPAMSPARA